MMRYASWLLVLAVLGCASSAPQSRFNIQALGGKSLWIPTARNSTDFDLRLPGTNPFRSLGEIAGKISPDYRPTVMDSLRDSIKREMEQQKVQARFPEEHDARLSVLPPGQEAAARIAREGGLDGSLFLAKFAVGTRTPAACFGSGWSSSSCASPTARCSGSGACEKCFSRADWEIPPKHTMML